ncbi:MAG TPA: phospholipase D-like domain-containing protein [Kiritimatiellia bacterium]|nr:phospholipase D-like domain-containing protein [Kiritimatiellia bacterium]HRZ11380.1 phospholipase D-like domain-containing protein [Kiritimatiellia bacterium]HSA17069.1 phospholipase D-like domain-containing protein [Kiritimatiellia bacterium]
MADIEFVSDAEIYRRVIQAEVPQARRFLWLATADLKDLHVAHGRHMIPFLGVLSSLCEQGVAIRLLHAKEPGPNFRRDFDRYANLVTDMERILCPRVHFKSVIVDGRLAYTGSANLTGAGMGAKSPHRRNFEAGIITTEASLVQQIMDQYDRVWMGAYCDDCGRQRHCPDQIADVGPRRHHRADRSR